MRTVRIIKNWHTRDFMRQTPGRSCIWDDFVFTEDPIEVCDYVVVFNHIPEDTTVTCPPEHIWCLTQEPPVPEYEWLKQGFSSFHRVYTQFSELHGERFIHEHGAIPWEVEKNYDFLKAVAPPDKPKALSCITGNVKERAGRKLRVEFLEKLQQQMEFDLWGRGFTYIEDKWDGLAPYRYSLAIENDKGPYYWSEKPVDVWLSWSIPIYYGCTRITEYFPPESLIQIDIEKPDEAIEIVREAVASDLWLKNRDAIAYARELILDKYQCFPFIVNEIRKFEAANPAYPPQQVHLKHLPYLYATTQKPKPSLARRVLSRAKRIVNRLFP